MFIDGKFVDYDYHGQDKYGQWIVSFVNYKNETVKGYLKNGCEFVLTGKV